MAPARMFAGREHAGDARLERQRLARLLPGPRVRGSGQQVPARQHEALRIAPHLGGQPVAARLGADEDEDGVDLLDSCRAVLS